VNLISPSNRAALVFDAARQPFVLANKMLMATLASTFHVVTSAIFVTDPHE
jgi:hypothetical protein